MLAMFSLSLGSHVGHVFELAVTCLTLQSCLVLFDFAVMCLTLQSCAWLCSHAPGFAVMCLALHP